MSAKYGMPGTAKSALAGDLGAHAASGHPWFGRPVSQGAVLYIAAERAALVKRRKAAWRLH
jgi:putative DNA primase/helicase